MQNVHVLLQPTEIATQAEYGDSRLAGSTEGNRSSDSAISTWARRVRVLDGQQVAEVAVQPVVGVLADRARVEDDDVGLGSRRGLAVPGRLQQAGEALGIVHVHLAPVGADLIGPLGGCQARHAP
jgi:hypothetical protein